MARIRTIKPEFFRHEELVIAADNAGLPLQLAFIGLWTVADKEGRFIWKPNRIKLDILPYADLNFADVLNALEQHGYVKSYMVEGSKYGYIPTFLKHQKTNPKESDSLIPAFIELENLDKPPSEATEASYQDGKSSSDLDKPSIEEEKISLQKERELLNLEKSKLNLEKLTFEKEKSQIKDGKSFPDLDIPSSNPEKPTVQSEKINEDFGKSGLEKEWREGEGEREREREREREQEQDKNIVTFVTADDADQSVDQKVVKSKKKPGELKAEIQQTFDSWLTTMNHPRAQLDDERKKLITRALGWGYTVQDLQDAITGCSMTPHNMGMNDNNQKYDGLHIILRTGGQIDRFVQNKNHPINPITTKRDQQNDIVGDEFMKSLFGENYVEQPINGEVYEH